MTNIQFFTIFITPIISLVIGLIILYFKLRGNLKKEILKVDANFKQEVMKLQYDYNKLLIEKRFECYPELLVITQEVGKQKYSVEENISIISEAYKELKKWRGKSCGYLLLTKKSYKSFNDLKEALSKNPLNPKKGYTKKQLEKIYKLRNELRGDLKRDVGISF